MANTPEPLPVLEWIGAQIPRGHSFKSQGSRNDNIVVPLTRPVTLVAEGRQVHLMPGTEACIFRSANERGAGTIATFFSRENDWQLSVFAGGVIKHTPLHGAQRIS